MLYNSVGTYYRNLSSMKSNVVTAMDLSKPVKHKWCMRSRAGITVLLIYHWSMGLAVVITATQEFKMSIRPGERFFFASSPSWFWLFYLCTKRKLRWQMFLFADEILRWSCHPRRQELHAFPVRRVICSDWASRSWFSLRPQLHKICVSLPGSHSCVRSLDFAAGFGKNVPYPGGRCHFF